MLPERVADRLAARRDELAPAERRVAEHLVTLGPEVALHSAAALAAQIGTSDATVVRTAKALGYSGLAELRWALAGHGSNPPPADRLRRTLDQTPRDELFTATIADHLASLDSLAQHVTAETFAAAVDVLAAGDRVIWRGVGP